MSTGLDIAVRKQVPTIPQALRSLAAMERELTTAHTYDEIRRVIKEATALKILLNEVAEVKAAAEDAILMGNRRIAEELAKLPKATGRRPKNVPRVEHSKKTGREDTGVPRASRSRLGKLANKSTEEIKATAAKLREQGKDATPNAVIKELTHGDKKERRAAREAVLAERIVALPDKKYGVIVEDYEWDQKTWSESGKDRHASNHYPTSDDAHTADEIVERTKDRFQCAAASCVTFMWVTVPHLAIGLDVMRKRGFAYKSHYVWGKDKIGTGYWNRNKHEILLIGVLGTIPCPAPGTQWESLIMAPVGEHSAKPECFLEMIEEYFPNVPRIELNRRGPPRPGWDAWGNETEHVAEVAE
jgi:N6-adenosine-specific RNA methylase IME4